MWRGYKSETDQGEKRSRNGQHGGLGQFVGSNFVLGSLVELRSFFLGGRTGDDIQLPKSDDSPESDLERFTPFSFGGRSSVDVDEGNVEALRGARQNAGLALVAGRRT
jgi:hypothetical protein